MKVILLENLKRIGTIGEVIDVKRGFARNFLIAYNINLNTRDHRLATDIAFELREAGRSKRIPNPNSMNSIII